MTFWFIAIFLRFTRKNPITSLFKDITAAV